MLNNLFSKCRTISMLGTSLWVPVVVASLTCILGLLLSTIQNQIGILSLISGLVLVMAIQFISIILVLEKVVPYSVDQIGSLRDEINRVIDKNSINFLLDNEQLSDFENKFPPQSEIWLVSNDLGEDIPGEMFFNVVRENLKKGISYTFFYPKTFEARARAQQLSENHKTFGDIKCIALSEDFFFLVPRMDFAIYDPLNRLNKRCGYMGLPNPEKSGRYHCFMEHKFVDLLIGKLQTLFHGC